MAQRLSTEAYGALREALSVVTWNKKPFASMMRGLLRDSPALLTGLNFDDPKRMVVDELVDRLVDEESRWQGNHAGVDGRGGEHDPVPQP